MAFFRARKIPKTQEGEKTSYTLYLPNPENEYVIPNDLPIQIVSIDPASKNYALRIEKRWSAEQIETLVFEKTDFTPQIDEKTNQNNIYQKLTSYLEQYSNIYKYTHLIIIERQPPINYITVRLSQHTLSYFLEKLKGNPLNPSIIEINPNLKKSQLGGPTHLTDRAMKKWFVSKTISLCQYSKDDLSLQIIESARKKDDLADARCQIEAFLSYCEWPTSLTKDEIISIPMEDDWIIGSKIKPKNKIIIPKVLPTSKLEIIPMVIKTKTKTKPKIKLEIISMSIKHIKK